MTSGKPGAADDAPPPADDPVVLEAVRRLEAVLGDCVREAQAGGRHPFLVVDAKDLREVCLVLRDDDALRYDCCHLVSGVDRPDDGVIEVVYHLVSYARRPDPSYRKREGKNDPFLVVKVRVPREKPEVPSVAEVWTGADWHERETWDLVGVVFTGRKELRRILLPEDWPGHPLRKDWTFPASYHDVPVIPPEAQP